jgi:hypothetical protein
MDTDGENCAASLCSFPAGHPQRYGKELNEPQMTPIGTDQRTKEGKKSVSICVICGLKQTGLRKEKVLAGFGADGHSGSYIKPLVTIPLRLRLHSM